MRTIACIEDKLTVLSRLTNRETACQQRVPHELPENPACDAPPHSSSLSICETGEQIAVIPDLWCGKISRLVRLRGIISPSVGRADGYSRPRS